LKRNPIILNDQFVDISELKKPENIVGLLGWAHAIVYVAVSFCVLLSLASSAFYVGHFYLGLSLGAVVLSTFVVVAVFSAFNLRVARGHRDGPKVVSGFSLLGLLTSISSLIFTEKAPSIPVFSNIWMGISAFGFWVVNSATYRHLAMICQAVWSDYRARIESGAAGLR